jgi:multimeric flavodoxin WrbA
MASKARSELLIVYHSMTGGSEQMALAASRGARGESGVEVTVKRAQETGSDHVLRAQGFIFATPENLASMSGLMKDFFDRTYYAALDRLNGRPYLTLICAGTDGRGAAQQIERIATGWRLKPIADPFIVITHASAPEDILRKKRIPPDRLAACEELGRTLAAGLSLGIF